MEACQSCTGCKNKIIPLQKVKNSINATCGQVVMLTVNRCLKLLVRVSFLLPALLLFVGTKCGGTFGGVTGFFLGLAFAFWMTTKEKAAYTITGLSERPTEKGDNDLD